MKAVLLAHFAATLFMTGVIWFVQVVHYPLFDRVQGDRFSVYAASHGRLTTWVVAPPMHHIDIHTPDGQVRRYTAGVATDPVTGVTADLAVVFS